MSIEQPNRDPTLFIKAALVQLFLPMLVQKHPRCFRERDAMLSLVGFVFLIVPFKIHTAIVPLHL